MNPQDSWGRFYSCEVSGKLFCTVCCGISAHYEKVIFSEKGKTASKITATEPSESKIKG